MAKIYVRMIQAGLMTLDAVPALWREAVKELMENEQDQGV